jgi:hypothetical protein
MSKVLKGMKKRDFFKACEKAGSRVELKRKTGEFHIVLPNGYRMTGSNSKRTVGAFYLTAARKAGVDV